MASGVALIMWHLIMHRLRRDDLIDHEEIQEVPQKPRFGIFRWLLAPVETGLAWRLAILKGISDRAEALAAHATQKAARKARKAAGALPVLNLDTEVLTALGARERLTVAFGALGAVDVPKALAMLSERGAPVDQSYAYKALRELGLADVKTPKTSRRQNVKKSPAKEVQS
jgi:hypothetical protein